MSCQENSQMNSSPPNYGDKSSKGELEEDLKSPVGLQENSQTDSSPPNSGDESPKGELEEDLNWPVG